MIQEYVFITKPERFKHMHLFQFLHSCQAAEKTVFAHFFQGLDHDLCTLAFSVVYS